MSSRIPTQASPVTIRYYAQLRENLGIREESLKVDWPLDEAQILRHLADRHPSQEKLILASRLAYQDAYLPSGTRLETAEVLDIISPVSGG